MPDAAAPTISQMPFSMSQGNLSLKVDFMRTCLLSLVYIIIAALPAFAQADAPARQLSHAEALNQMSGVMYLHEMATRCPLPEEMSEAYDLIAMVFIPTLPTFTPEEIAATADKLKTRVTRELLQGSKSATRLIRPSNTWPRCLQETCNANPAFQPFATGQVRLLYA